MADYIDRQAAIEAIDESLKRVFVLPVGKSIMDKIPAADVRPVVSATWYDDGLYGMIKGRFYSCPVCKAQNVGKSNFCPNCGANMREES